MLTFDETQALWSTVQGELKKIVSESDFSGWFAPVVCAGIEDDALLLVAPNDFSELWINKNYSDLLRTRISLAAGRKMGFRLQSSSVAQPESLPVPAKPVAARESARHAPAVLPPAIKAGNTFENFIRGPENELALASALAAANDPGHAGNPLFIYGATGLGKTHLMHAIAHTVFKNSPGKNVVYVTSEKFTNEFIQALTDNAAGEFQKRYRDADVLLVDDVQFFAKKDRTQEEFFHTFNALYLAHKQIVLTSDRPVRELLGLEERLVSRFAGGMTADITAPRLETRESILRRKAANAGITLGNDVFEFLANGITRNVRNLEGAITRIAGYLRLGNGNAATVETVGKLLQDILLEEASNKLSPEIIQKKVAEYYRIQLLDMTSKKRTAQVAFARQVAMYLCTQLTGLALAEIGEAFGGRDHGTVIHARRTVEDRMGIDVSIKRAVDYLLMQISTRTP